MQRGRPEAILALGHGVPLFHAGDEVLRSKSLDRDSYNSGDWFNRRPDRRRNAAERL